MFYYPTENQKHCSHIYIVVAACPPAGEVWLLHWDVASVRGADLSCLQSGKDDFI